MKYQSQKIAYAYFAVALGLFAIQILGGLLAGFAFPDDEGVPLVPVLQDGFIIGR